MELVSEIWRFTREVSFYLLAGFFLAGLIRAFVTEKTVSAHLGGGFKGVLYAALIGVPLPLCSCSVLPTAAALRRQGASRAATSSFLISTPETGVDSIAVSYAMLDLVMTVARPVAALLTALATGAAELLFNPERKVPPAAETQASPDPAAGRAPLASRLAEGLHYSFFVLLADLAVYLAAGLVLAGAVSYALPAGSLAELPGGQWTATALIIGIGIPLYICATSSTPLAAALIAKGLSPGAALLLLLVGPATNLSSLSVIWRILGPRSLAVYLAGITACGLALSFALDRLYPLLGLDPAATIGAAGELLPGAVENVCGLALCLLLARGIYVEKVRPRLKKRL
ncbi:MAG: SO_0444 family Cu/Zn efflux transporter [Candidatus Glassbacteria bacterium]|nr:SO_0444 family Cu/Zn efflux transporter [Candidatus Glassbacteria bacterium]